MSRGERRVRAVWYVIQVMAGREEAVAKKIERAAADFAEERGTAAAEVLQECFSPRFKTKVRQDGKWVDDERPLLPGYLVAVTGSAAVLDTALKRVPELTRILGNDNAFIPLKDDEAAWIDAFTRKGYRVVEMSEGFKEGGKVTVTSGPLVGYEGAITKIDRRKHEAYLQLEIMGRKKEVKVGFNLVRKAQ